MPRKDCEAVPESKCPTSQQEEFGSGEPTLADIYRLCEERFYRQQKIMDSYFDRWDKKLDEISDEMRKMDEHVTRLEYGAWQPRLTMKADGPADTTKTRERTEGAAIAVQVMRGDCFSARRVEPGPNTNSTSFGVKAGPPALPCRDDSVVESGTAAFESCLPSLEIHPSTAAGGLVPTGEASKATETNPNEPPLRFCSTEEMNREGESKMEDSWTSIPSASNDSSSVLQERNLSATPYYRRVVDTKSGQNRTFDPGGSRGHLRACPFLGSWCALVCGEDLRAEAAEDELQRLFGRDSLVLWNRPIMMPCQEKVSPSRAARGYTNWREERRSRRHGDSKKLEVRDERLSRKVMER